MFNCCICGCRDFNNYNYVKEKTLYLLQNKLPDVCIISGGAKGVDTLAEMFADEFNLELKVIKANWEKYGRSAGPKRNEEMVKISNGVIAFWDYKSRGTKITIVFCKKHNVQCKVIYISNVN